MIQCTVQLLDWSETKRGQKVVLEIMGDTDGQPFGENPFKAYTTRDGKKGGQLFGAALVQLDADTGQPAEEIAKPKGQKRSQLAFLMCRDEMFWRYVNEHVAHAPMCTSEQNCVGWMYDFIGISSRSELDRVAEAQQGFDVLVEGFEQFRDEETRVFA